MGKPEVYLIPSRFACTLGHLFVVLAMFSHFETNVRGGLGSNPTTSQINEGKAELQNIWIFALCCFGVDFAGLLTGCSLFFRSVNLFHICIHFVGALYTSWFVLHHWSYLTFWSLAIAFNLLPALVEGCLLIGVFALNVVQY